MFAQQSGSFAQKASNCPATTAVNRTRWKTGEPFRGPRDPEKLIHFVASLKAHGVTAKQIRDIEAADMESGLLAG